MCKKNFVTTLKSVQTIVFIATTSTSPTLSIKKVDLIMFSISTGVASGLSSSDKK